MRWSWRRQEKSEATATHAFVAAGPGAAVGSIDRLASSPKVHFGRLAVIGACALAIGGLIGWAATTVLTPSQDALTGDPYTYAQVVEGEVSSAMGVAATATWTPSAVGANMASGTVTTVNVAQGAEVAQGTVLYTVDLRPVTAAQGSVPAFRDLQQGAVGADVTQLQQFLTTTGYEPGTIDGRFLWSTAAAVKRWQMAAGIEPDGIVRASDLIFVPTLPARILLDSEVIYRGSRVSGGETVVSGLPSSPEFIVALSEAQARDVSTGASVHINGPDGIEWTGRLGDAMEADDDAVHFPVLPVDGQDAVCGTDCGVVPVTGDTEFPSEVVTLEPVGGLTVPTSALRTTSGGGTVVIDQDGLAHEVRVVASARGMAVVTGVTEGTQVRLPPGEK